MSRAERSPSPGLVEIKRTRRILQDQAVWGRPDLKELVQNAAVCSKAVYSSTDLECEKYITETMRDHALGSVARSRHGRCGFMVVEEDGNCSGGGRSRRVYVAFRGTHSTEDWKDNLKAYQVEGGAMGGGGGNSNCKSVRGRIHAGFLERAAAFPVDKLLGDESLQDKQLVLCGHSLGGAVATVVAIVLMAEVEKRRASGLGRDREVLCFTFGSPLVGDAGLRSFCDERGISRRLFHFVSEGDPVPRLLSYAQCLSAFSSQLDNQVRALLSTYSTSQGASFYEERKRSWIDQKERCLDVLSRVIPAVEPILETAAIVCPKYSGMLVTAKLGSSLAKDLVSAASKSGQGPKKRAPYVCADNFMFLTLEENPIPLEFHEEDRIARCFEMSLETNLTDTVQEIPVHHSVEHYQELVTEWGGWAGEYAEFHTTTTVLGGEAVTSVIPRRIEFVDRFCQL